VALSQYPEFDGHAKDLAREICRAAKALNMPLEYNLTGCEKQRNDPRGLGYPCCRFWEMAAEEGCTARPSAAMRVRTERCFQASQ